MHTYFMHVGDRSHEREWLWNVTILRLSHDVAGNSCLIPSVLCIGKWIRLIVSLEISVSD
jgi:hypothetical protein